MQLLVTCKNRYSHQPLISYIINISSYVHIIGGTAMRRFIWLMLVLLVFASACGESKATNMGNNSPDVFGK